MCLGIFIYFFSFLGGFRHTNQKVSRDKWMTRRWLVKAKCITFEWSKVCVIYLLCWEDKRILERPKRVHTMNDFLCVSVFWMGPGKTMLFWLSTVRWMKVLDRSIKYRNGIVFYIKQTISPRQCYVHTNTITFPLIVLSFLVILIRIIAQLVFFPHTRSFSFLRKSWKKCMNELMQYYITTWVIPNVFNRKGIVCDKGEPKRILHHVCS